MPSLPDIEIQKIFEGSELTLRLPIADVKSKILLKANYDSSVRAGVTFHPLSCVLSVDIPDNASADYQDYQKRMLRKKAAELTARGAIKLDKGLLKLVPEAAGETINEVETITHVRRIPLVLFHNSREECKHPMIAEAPFLYAGILNTRIHFGNLFYGREIGWGLSVTVEKYNPVCEIVDRRFEKMCEKFISGYWHYITAMYENRLACEFIVRNGLIDQPLS